MAKKIILSIDAMGGDNAPKAVIEGLNRARRKIKDTIEFHIFGNKTKITSFLKKYPLLEPMCKIFDTKNNVVSNEAKVKEAIRNGRETSMAKAIEHVKNKKADGIVSAGNTAVLMGTSLISLRAMEGISRPALTTMLPNQKGASIVLDLGANAECNETNLQEFAIMGSVYGKTILNMTNPTVGILNIGEEKSKGKEYLRKAYDNLKQAKNTPFKFHGFIEGDDIGKGTTDIVVTDGFTGNAVLKTIEGTSKLITKVVKEEFKKSLLAKLALFLLFPLFSGIRKRIDPRRYNGALFAGLNGIVVKSHGSSDYVAFSNAVIYAYNLIKNNFNEKIKNEIAKHRL